MRGKPLSRGTAEGIAYAKFKAHKFSYLNVTAIGSDYVGKGSECGFACVNIPSCFSFNLAAFHDMNGKVLCELLPSDLYNNSDKLVPSQRHHHYRSKLEMKKSSLSFCERKGEELQTTAYSGFLLFFFNNTPKG